MKSVTLLIVLILAAICIAHKLPSASGDKWVVLVAGSNTWMNYRHQSDVCRAYKLLRSTGFPEQRIITFMYDDIAMNPNNIYPGKIFNDYNYDEVYMGTKIDYRGDDVSPENFLKVLNGDKGLKAQGKKVLESGENDEVFIYFSDHGGTQLLAFPNSVLYANDLISTLENMREKKKYKEMTIYVEACESGSMFKKLLPRNIKIYVNTAANSQESSYAAFCEPKGLGTCLSDEYSYHWLHQAEQVDLNNYTLKQEFQFVQKQTTGSHVSQYGDVSFVNAKMSKFLGSKANALPEANYSPALDLVPSHEAHLVPIRHRIEKATTDQQRQLAEMQLSHRLHRKQLVEKTFDYIEHAVKAKDMVNLVPLNDWDVMVCFRQIHEVFSKRCFATPSTPEVIPHLKKIEQICEAGYNAKDVINIIEDICA